MSMITPPGASAASAQTPVLTVAAQSRWPCNGVAVAPDGTMFLGLPRFPGHTETPSLVRVEQDGALSPFPGGAWNAWRQGGDGREAFVMVNAVHVFNDGTLWVVDQGAVGESAVPGGHKIVRLDPRTGAVLAVIRFGDDILPDGATMNDLRLHDHMLYVTDSGLGGLIVHDLGANRTLRRLSGHPLLRRPADAAQKGHGARLLADAAGRR
ncbi:bleomycin resistance protein, partial [Methylobacterium frigidaeris]